MYLSNIHFKLDLIIFKKIYIFYEGGIACIRLKGLKENGIS